MDGQLNQNIVYSQRVVKWEKFDHVLLGETSLWELRTHMRTTTNATWR